MLHIQQTEGYLFCKEIREAFEYPFLVAMTIFQGLFLTVLWAIGFDIGKEILWVSILSLLIICINIGMWIKYIKTTPVVHSRWFIEESQIGFQLSDAVTTASIQNVSSISLYEMKYYLGKASIKQRFIIFSNIAFADRPMPRNFFNALKKGAEKGWVVLPDCCEIRSFLADNGIRGPIPEYPKAVNRKTGDGSAS